MDYYTSFEPVKLQCGCQFALRRQMTFSEIGELQVTVVKFGDNCLLIHKIGNNGRVIE